MKIGELVLFFPVLLFAVTVHEYAHGYIAYRRGDSTAKMMGRLTLNPIAHIDVVGSILIPAALMLLGLPAFGWAKPVPVDFSRLRHPKRDMLWVAAAGPASNFVMALFWASMIKLAVTVPSIYSEPLSLMGQAGVMINVVLMVLNLLPLPPLDGGRIAVSLLPNRLADQYAQIERYGFIILLVLLATGVLATVMEPFINALITLIEFIF